MQTVHQIADRHRKTPSRTAAFERTEKDGWSSEMFAPSWIVFDDDPFPRSAPASRVGADAPEILSTLGYSSDEITRMTESGAIGRTEWAKG